LEDMLLCDQSLGKLTSSCIEQSLDFSSAAQYASHPYLQLC